MIASIMLYASVIGVLVALTAAAVEAAAQGRLRSRYIWSVALIAISVAPALAVLRVPLSSSLTIGHAGPPAAEPVSHTGFAVDASSRTTTADPLSSGKMVRRSVALVGSTTVLARDAIRLSSSPATDAVLGTVWVVSSILLTCWILVTSVRCRRAVTVLPRILIDGFDVALSEATGPAVVGMFRETILLPRWALRLPAEDRHLILFHEAEHVAAHDSRRILLALSAIIAMPWNPAIWWCFFRLRRAVEIDCDARVVGAAPDVQAYGSLLLRVAARDLGDRGLTFQPGFLRMSTQLERRIRALAMTRRFRPRPLIQGVAAAFIFGSATPFIPLPALIAPPPIPIYGPSGALRHGHPSVLLLHSPAIVKIGKMQGASTGGQSMTPAKNRPSRGVPHDENVFSRTDSNASDTIPRVSRTRGVARDTADTLIDSSVSDTLEARMRSLKGSTQSLAAAERDMGQRMRGLAKLMQESDTLEARARSLKGSTQSLAATKRDMGQRMRGLAKLMQEQARANTVSVARWDTQIRAAVAARFPDIRRSATDRTTIWFLADSSGRVLRAERDEDGPPKVVSPEIVGRKFGLLGASAVSDVYYARYQANGYSVATIWSVTR